MLKGTTIIELTDIESGETKVVEDTNFITNALNDICQPILRNQDCISNAVFKNEGACSAQALMRGLLLFDSELGSNPANYFPPSTAKMVGHGSEITYSGNDVTMGSFNLNQSDLSSDNERTFVWDFTAEQANGLIKSVCLTTQAGGNVGYPTETPMEELATNLRPFSNIIKSSLNVLYGQSVPYHERSVVYLSFAKDLVVQLDFTKIQTGKLYFKKVGLNSKFLNIFDNFQSYTSINNAERTTNHIGKGLTSEESVEIDVSSVIGSGRYFGFAQDGKHLYVTSIQNSNEVSETNAWASGTVLKLVKVDLETLQYEVISVTNTTGKTLSVKSTYDAITSYGNTFGVASGYMFARSWVADSKLGSDIAELYAINLSDNTDVVKVLDATGKSTVVGAYTTSGPAEFGMSIQGRPTFTNKQYGAYSSGVGPHLLHCVSLDSFLVNYLGTTISSVVSQGTLNNTGITSRCFPTDNPLYYGVEIRPATGSITPLSQCIINVVPNALMTINNLADPVEKTPAQTMRITYKITKE